MRPSGRHLTRRSNLDHTATPPLPRAVGGAAAGLSGAPGRSVPRAEVPRIGGAAAGSGAAPTPVATSSAARPAAAHLKDGAFYSQAPGRAVGGLSMGGFATLYLAFNYPHIFDTVGVHSPSLRTAEEVPDFLDGERAFAQVGPLALAATIDRADAPRL